MLNQLIIFVKNPVLGTVKTRLAKSIGDGKALEVYLDLMEKCRQEVQKVDCKRHLFYSQYIVKSDDWTSQLFDKRIQAEGDLGVKISEAFKTVFQENSKVLIIGSDCYDLTDIIIQEAFRKLDEADVVVGPANDGGYYLLGTKQLHPDLFQEITWSTESVLEETVLRAKSKNLSVVLLKELIDLDTLEDLKKSGYDLKE